MPYKYHIRHGGVQYCRKESYGEERYKRMYPTDNPKCDIDEHFDSYEEAYKALLTMNGVEFELNPKNVNPELKEKYNEYWKDAFSHFGDIDEDPLENYDWEEVDLGYYESSVTYYFKFDGERVYFSSEPYYGDSTEIADWDYNHFVEMSTQIEMEHGRIDLEDFVKKLLLEYDCEFEFIEVII